jgi:Fur family transcriptional regulator, peroxide stress response regulator
MILQTLKESPTHPTAEELYQDLKKKLPRISLGTVYRNLNLLMTLKIISQLESSGSTSIRYDARNDEHCHLICNTCGKVVDVALEYFSSLDSIVREQLGFAVLEHGIVLKGTCQACLQKNETYIIQ